MKNGRINAEKMISIVIPAYNEALRIRPTLDTYLKHFPRPFELIVVLNGCTDNTKEVVSSCTSRYPDIVKIMDFTDPIGKGGAVREGFKSAKGDIIGFVDADMATPISDIQSLITTLDKSHAQLNIASRLVAGSRVHGRGLVRTVVSKTFALLVSLLFDVQYADTQCGAKFLTRKALEDILPDLTAYDMTIDVDILLSAKKHRIHVREIPTEWYDRSSSALLGSPLGIIKNGAKMFFSLLKLQRKYENV